LPAIGQDRPLANVAFRVERSRAAHRSTLCDKGKSDQLATSAKNNETTSHLRH
jgi:hypothetical protein